MTKLRDICRFQSGGTPSRGTPAYFNGNVPWITTVALNGDVIDGNQAIEWITDEAIAKSAAKIVPPHSVMVGTRVGIGKVAINSVPMSTSQDIISLIGIDENKWDKKFICHLITANKEHLTSQARGATIKGIKIEAIADLVLPEISLKEQARISEVIGKVDALMHMHQQMAMNLEQLIKSRFIELFGDPERNPKKWPVVSITEIIRGKVSNGFFAKRDAYRNDGNVQVLGVANIVNRMYSNIEGLPRTNATQAEKEKYRVRYGDMLFCRSSLVAEGIGKASIVPQDTPQNVIFECHVIRLPLDLQKCVPEFVQELSTTPYFRKQIIAQSKTATMTTIGQDGILKAAIILPPVERQQEFLRFIEQTDKSKLAVQKGLQELEILKKSLMQQYFG